MMMSKGLERAPVYPDGMEGTSSTRHRESLLAFNVLMENIEWIENYLMINSAKRFVASDRDLQARRDQLAFSKASSYAMNRGIYQVSLLAEGTVQQMEEEFGSKRILDIGCGKGKLGLELARKAKSEVIFLDKDIDVLPNFPKRQGSRVVADGIALPFKDESFPRTVSSFSSLVWSDTPTKTVQSINEALRVTEPGGTTLVTPIMSNISSRRSLALSHEIVRLGGRSPGNDVLSEWALKVWAAQDYSLMEALLHFAEEGYCAITWGGYFGSGQTTGATIETYSAIVDKLKPIPQEIFDENISFASRFMEN